MHNYLDDLENKVKGSNLRRNGNLLAAIVLAAFIVWHYILGTDNPIQANSKI